MAYQTAGPQAWGGAGGAGAAPGMSDPYYSQYYAAYGYPSGYDYSAYYQQQGQSYPPGAASQSAQPPPPGTTAVAPPAPPSSPPPPGAEPDKASDADKPPPPPPGGPPPAPGAAGAKPAPPAPPPGGPPPAPSSTPAASSAGAPSAAAAAAAAAAYGGYDSAAYAQWYAQYGYYGYDPQYAQYWQQQQQQQQAPHPGGYGGAGQQPGYPHQHQQPKPGVPPPAPPKGDPPPGTGGKPGQATAAAGSAKPYSGVIDSYNAQPPPANLYGQQNGHHNHHNQQHNNRNQRAGLTGTNMTPLGPRPPPGDPPASAAGQQPQQQLTPQQHAAAVAARFGRGPVVIRPQMPTARPAATPAYIAVGGAASSAAAPGKTGVAAAVAAAAAGAAAAAAAARSGSTAAGGTAAAGAGGGGGNTQWPPSFTAWVTRCFNAARLRGVPDSRLSEKLMAYLDQVKAEGRLWTTDWDTQPVMLPDGAAGGAGAASGADGGALSPSGPQGRKRNRWGAVPAGDSAGPGGYRSAAGGRGHERSQDVDSDEEDYGQYGQRHGAPSPHGGHQHLSNRKRKKLLALEARQQQQQRGGHHQNAYTSAEEQKRRARAGRFGDGRAAGAGRYGGSESDDVSDDEYDDDDRRFGSGGQIVVGTSNNLEKSYFRLTSQPDPATVRPEPVLTRALDRLVRLIAAREATYFYSLDQFKGMRQDCTVQHLRNALTVRVYEAHGRSSLEYGDVAEFNQCQARLGHLYAEGVPGCVAEFTGYRLLYETVHAATAGRRHAGSMTKALLHTMRNVPHQLAGAPEIRHALQVREAVMNFNYSGFFRLYATAPHLGRAILDVVVEPLRWAGVNAFVKAADLPVPLSALALILGFQLQPPRGQQPDRKNQAAEGGKQEEAREAVKQEEEEVVKQEEAKKEAAKKEAVPLPGCRFAHLAGDAAPVADEEEAVQRCAQWLADHGAVVVEKGSELMLDTKASRGKLFVPEVTEKIETGDLSVTDFLSRARVAVE
ncbi:hypothetical protein HYH02_011174 [Chlamydomonas schloesseri]|uniref:SAC3/GANP/THP3 conserved domain-containing protein n=1 Tax=Chlamydomonas schloesseri TaxID=2026947 RepID=A0A835W6K8_9CHLO|nr:hypothetical protein HYH02_011174 [Chlamydomonas schloesseri]|eukprot:KAG2437531.1 hypothetical protein HYH02_011174 [Chlamydomonas schloesseri]